MIGMRMQIRLRQTFECRVCKQFRDEDIADDVKITAMLFGVAPYAVCPSCWQEPANHGDQNYRARFRRFMARARERGLTIAAPISSFESPRGRMFEMRAGTYKPPRFKGDDLDVGTTWPIFFRDEEAGSISFDLMYDRKVPTYHGTPRKLVWRFASDAPTGVGFDLDRSDTLEEIIARWSRRADEILDWHEGLPVSIWPSGLAKRVPCGGTLRIYGIKNMLRCDQCKTVQYADGKDGDRCPRHRVEKVKP